MQEKNVTKRAIEAAGGPSKVARHFQLTPGAVCTWARKNKAEAERVIDLCRMTQGAFQPHQLRPDVFGPEVMV